MTTTPEQVPAATTGNITFEDVRMALGDTDPDQTHAGKLRAIMGRGSNKTIQLHLDAIRKARAPVMPGTQAPPPSIPKDLIELIWSASWAAAQAGTYGRTERLSAERDAAMQLGITRASEILGLNAEVDGLREKITLAERNADALTTKAQADLEAAAQAAAEAAKTIEQLKAEKTKIESDAEHAAQMAERDATIAEQKMQSTINWLNTQIGDLKGLLIVRTAPTQPAA